MSNEKMIPRVYVAGAYTGTRQEQEDNVRRASFLAYAVGTQYCFPVVPHLVGEVSPAHTWQWWCRATMQEMVTCDAVLVVPPKEWERPQHWKDIKTMGPDIQGFLRSKFLKESTSKGTNLEIKEAIKRNIPLFFTVTCERLPHAFIEWLEDMPKFRGRREE